LAIHSESDVRPPESKQRFPSCLLAWQLRFQPVQQCRIAQTRFQLAANLSLKLPLENSYSAFERVIQCGGWLSALPPEIASKHLSA